MRHLVPAIVTLSAVSAVVAGRTTAWAGVCTPSSAHRVYASSCRQRWDHPPPYPSRRCSRHRPRAHVPTEHLAIARGLFIGSLDPLPPDGYFRGRNAPADRLCAVTAKAACPAVLVTNRASHDSVNFCAILTAFFSSNMPWIQNTKIYSIEYIVTAQSMNSPWRKTLIFPYVSIEARYL